MIWAPLVVAILGTLIWFGNGIRMIGAVSSGDPIGDRSETAMLLIDLQPAFWEAGTYTEEAKEAAKASILAEVRDAKSGGVPIIAARHEWSIPSTKAVARLLGKGLAIEGTPGTELIECFNDLADHVLVKRVQDAFETGELDRLLAKLDVGKLRIVGLDTNYCVAKTALAARQRGYEVEIVRRGVLSADPRQSEKTLEMLQERQVSVR